MNKADAEGDCQLVNDRLEAYLANKLNKNDRDAFEAHLSTCDACDESVQCSRAVAVLVGYVQTNQPQQVKPKATIFERIFGVKYNAG